MVECKSSPQAPTHVGVVIKVCPLLIRVAGFHDGRWRYVRARETREVVLSDVTNVYSTPDSHGNVIEKVNMGMKVRVLETIGDFAHIITPTEGWINLKQSRTNISAPIVNKSVLPTIEVAVMEGMSAKDLAMYCKSAGGLPKKVSIKVIKGQQIGIVCFEDEESAERVINRGISHLGWSLQMRWSEEYSKFREKKI